MLNRGLQKQSSEEVRVGTRTAIKKVGYGLGYSSIRSGVRNHYLCRRPKMALTDTAIRASTILNEREFDEAHIELQLAHTKRNKVAAAYNHAKYLKQRTEMMQWWADYLDAQLAKGRRAPAA